MTSIHPKAVASLCLAADVRRGAMLLLMLATSLLLFGCAQTRGGSIPYEVEGFGVPDSPAAVPLEEDYKISPLDQLKIAVFQVPDLSGDFEVDLTGNIAMPLIGTIRAIDKTPRTLQIEIAQRLGEKYLQSPDVSVAVKSSSTRTVTVDGAVREPGVYPIERSVSLLQMIARAKGPNEEANPRRVAIFRTIGGQRMAAAFDLVSIRRGEAEDPKIYNGDIVVVDGSGVKAARREILQALPILGIFNPYGLIAGN